jgi:predicted transcriptional regulator
MTKRTILSLSEETLKQVDRLAAEMDVSRAEFIRRAIAAYAGEIGRKQEEERICRKRAEAIGEIERLREEFSKVKDPDWDPVRVIREWRDKDRMARMYEREKAGGMVEVREEREKP